MTSCPIINSYVFFQHPFPNRDDLDALISYNNATFLIVSDDDRIESIF